MVNPTDEISRLNEVASEEFNRMLTVSQLQKKRIPAKQRKELDVMGCDAFMHWGEAMREIACIKAEMNPDGPEAECVRVWRRNRGYSDDRPFRPDFYEAWPG